MVFVFPEVSVCLGHFKRSRKQYEDIFDQNFPMWVALIELVWITGLNALSISDTSRSITKSVYIPTVRFPNAANALETVVTLDQGLG